VNPHFDKAEAIGVAWVIRERVLRLEDGRNPFKRFRQFVIRAAEEGLRARFLRESLENKERVVYLTLAEQRCGFFAVPIDVVFALSKRPMVKICALDDWASASTRSRVRRLC
jgi:hypothetical protein